MVLIFSIYCITMWPVNTENPKSNSKYVFGQQTHGDILTPNPKY